MDKEYIKNIISDIEAEHVKENAVPSYVLMEDVKRTVIDDLLNALREMCKDGTLEWHKTINSVGFSVRNMEKPSTIRKETWTKER
jgi:hypothetical protein